MNYGSDYGRFITTSVGIPIISQKFYNNSVTVRSRL